ncbi:MAG: hypothetical protein PHX30_03215 [Candidatus Pacebacteria bacterium]|nr:hypothetical protein [Candidatus Paceibacterota bacterium]
MQDTELNDNDGAPFRVPGDGIITTEKEYLGSAVPDNFTVYYNLTDNQHVAAATLKSGGATVPDRLVFAHWGWITDSDYDYTVDLGRSLTSDSAYAVYWNPTTLAPGESHICDPLWFGSIACGSYAATCSRYYCSGDIICNQ